MSKLPKAPLLEVIFEIKWEVINKQDIVNFQYFHGDLYANIKQKFSYRESLIPPEIPFDVVKGIPVYRFRKAKDEYPLIQIGPGLLSYNIIDEIYFWNSFKKDIDKITKVFFNVYPKSTDLKLVPSLTYIDFFDVHFNSQNPVDFINSNLLLNIQQDFIHEKPAGLKDINLTLNYQMNKNMLSLNFRNGIINENKSGLILQTKLIGNKKIYLQNDLFDWLDDAHEICSNTFKQITKKEFYNTFK